MKHLDFILVAGLLLATTSAPTITAQDVTDVDISSSSTLPIKGISISSDNDYNFKNFEVVASTSGDYYVEFWLMPAKYADGTYTNFKVYVNENYLGEITPTFGNWQSIRIDSNDAFNLNEGTNVISVATKCPELPEVETIKVSKNDTDAVISSKAYEEYLEDSTAGVRYKTANEHETDTYAINSNGVGIKHFSNVPLNYTFHHLFEFDKDQEITLTSTSSAPHIIDIMFYAWCNPNWTIESGLEPERKSNLQSRVAIKDPYLKRAKSEQMQGLSWKVVSEKAINSTAYVATKTLKMPEKGIYLIKVRHAEDGGSSVADVIVNGEYFYENIPISLAYRKCEIPNDGNKYATFTCCDNFGVDDPYIFIHGAGSDRSVGFDDDSTPDIVEEYDISDLDSYISQTYYTKTSGISVCSYSSSKPRSKCSITARVLDVAAQSASKTKAKDYDTAYISASPVCDDSIIISAPNDIHGSFLITAHENIQSVSVYGLTGNFVGSIRPEDSSIEVPAHILNIAVSGIYVIRVETPTGIVSKKVVIK